MVVGAVMLSGCCAPDSCYVAKSRFDQLDPVIAELLAFQQLHGHFPVRLEELFPDGLPDDIASDENEHGSYRFATEKGGFTTLYYGPAEGMLGSPLRGKTSEQAVALHFTYVGGGVLSGMNDCYWTSTDRIWQCFGHI